jgi:Carboxypeptidase regulatory-like domain
MDRRIYRCLYLCFFVLFSAVALRADVTGSIQGYVRDSSGAVISGAHVVVIEVSTNLKRETITDDQGAYTFLALPPGKYNVTATLTGFQQATINDIDLTVNDRLRFDLTLAVGSVQQNVSVEANALQVQTSSTQIGSTVESKEILALPLNGRSYLDLLGLQAGVVPLTSGTLPNDRPVSGLFVNAGNVSVNGQPESANAFFVNGGDVSETKNMGAGLIPVLDSIQEFRLITNSYDAEYGKFSGAVMNAITKSGTNGLHGDVFEFLRNDALDARNFFDPVKANLHRNQFGYAVGGPLVKNKLFWFTDYQGTRQTAGASTGRIQLPTDAERAGNFAPQDFVGPNGPATVNGAYFAQVLSQRLGYTVQSGEPYSVAGCTSTANCVFPNGLIPQAAFDPVAVNLLKYFPHANIDPTTGLYADSSTKNTVRDDSMGQRIDFVNATTGNWSFYYHYDDSTAINALGGQAYNGSPALPGFPTSSPSRNQMFVLSNTKVFGATSVNEFRLSFFRTSILTAQPSASTNASLASLGFTTGAGTLGINPSGAPGYPQSMPPLSFNNYDLGNNWLNLFQANNNYMAYDSFSKIVGKHSLKFGGEFRLYQLNVTNVCGPNGTFAFTGGETGSDFADFLLGAPATYVQCSLQYLANRSRYGGLFVQDSWKLKPNLTLNLGLRYEISTPWSDAKGELSTIVPGVQSVLFPTAPLGYLVPGDPGVSPGISPTRYNNFAPRIGLAYSPSSADGFLGKLFGGPGQSSIRASYGIYYLGAADVGNFGVIGDAPWGLYWQSLQPPLLDTPFQSRSTGSSQGQRFPFTFPTIGGTHPNFNFAQYLPLFAPGYDTQNRLTYAEHYNLSIQRQLTKTMVMTLAYVGTQSHRLQLTKNINVGSAALCSQLNAEGATPTCGPNSETTTFVLPDGSQVYGTFQGPLNNQALGEVAYGGISLNSNIGKSAYNSFQATVERRAGDLSFLAAYTYSKSMDNVSTTLNVLNPQSSYVLSPFDLTHNFVVSYTYAVPFDRAFRSVPRRITQGWSINGISRFATGFPVTLSQSGDLSLTGLGFDFPNVVGPVVTQNPRNTGPNGANTYFLPGAFASENVGQIGNSGARFFHGPGIINTDAGISKTTRITESTSFLIRGEFFNIFNHANFTGIVGNFSSSQFGTATNTLPARVGQVSAKFTW